MLRTYENNSNKSGIYQIKNIQNGKVYIGSTKCFKVRASQHESALKKGYHGNKHLLASWNKYGSENFVFEVIEVIEDSIDVIREKEQVYINSFLSNWEQCYNLDKKTNRCQKTWSKNPDVTIRKKRMNMISRWASDSSYRERMSGHNSPNYGKQLSQNQKEKLLSAIKGNKWNQNRVHSQETRTKMSSASSKRGISEAMRNAQKTALLGKKQTHEHIKKRVDNRQGYNHSQTTKTKIGYGNSKFYIETILSPDGNFYSNIQNLSEFSREHNLNRSKLLLVIQGKRSHHKGWTLVVNKE